MHIDEFDFTLPNEQIAQEPIADRTASRLMVVDRQSGERMHTIFSQLPQYLSAGDLLVLNDSRVRPARLIGIKEETGAKIELLLLKPLGEDRWEALVKPAKRVKKGTVIRFGEQGELTAIAEEERPFAGGRSFLLQYPEGADLEELFNRLGQMPLPPYIRQELADPERYQTVYSREVGSAAAPTAGLHFTESLLEEVKAKGVQIAFLTLHVGLGTFRPVTAERIEEHQMHAEFYHLPQKTAQQIAQTRKNGGRVIAVGTTSVRTLETIAQQGETLQETSGWTDIFIYPGYRFRLVDGIITNFHLPKSTLLMLVSAFSSREKILAAYREAVEKGYRFFSFGDSMFLC